MAHGFQGITLAVAVMTSGVIVQIHNTGLLLIVSNYDTVTVTL